MLLSASKRVSTATVVLTLLSIALLDSPLIVAVKFCSEESSFPCIVRLTRISTIGVCTDFSLLNCYSWSWYWFVAVLRFLRRSEGLFAVAILQQFLTVWGYLELHYEIVRFYIGATSFKFYLWLVDTIDDRFTLNLMFSWPLDQTSTDSCLVSLNCLWKVHSDTISKQARLRTYIKHENCLSPKRIAAFAISAVNCVCMYKFNFQSA